LRASVDFSDTLAGVATMSRNMTKAAGLSMAVFAMLFAGSAPEAGRLARISQARCPGRGFTPERRAVFDRQ
jgi:hypothetical protein